MAANVAGALPIFDSSAESEANNSTISMNFSFRVQNSNEQSIRMELNQGTSMEKSQESENDIPDASVPGASSTKIDAEFSGQYSYFCDVGFRGTDYSIQY